MAVLLVDGGYIAATIVFGLICLTVYLLLLRSAGDRTPRLQRVGASLLFAEGSVVTSQALGPFGPLPMVGFAGIGDGGAQAAIIAFLVVGGIVVGGCLFWLVIAALAIRGSRWAGYVGIVLSILSAGAGFLILSGYLELIPTTAITVVLIVPAICMYLGLRAGRRLPVRTATDPA